MVRTLLFAAAIAAAVSASIHAETQPPDTSAQVLGGFGLIGTWAADCKAPASHDNLYMVFSPMPTGEAKREYFDGPSLYNTYPVYEAKVQGDKITFIASDMNIPYVDWSIGPYNRAYEITYARRDNSIRLWSSGGPRGLIVDGGRAIDTHVETAWLQKCR